jgi:hypothetical protein
VTRRLAAFLLALALVSCGGSPSSPAAGSSATPVPPVNTGPNPCAAALAASGGVSASAAHPAPKHDGLGRDKRGSRELLALHGLARGDRVSARTTKAASAARSGDVAVLADDGSLLLPANAFDLAGAALRFEPNGQGGYDVRGATTPFRGDVGRRVALQDDDSSEQGLAFAFPFYGASRASAFVNSDGNVTFGAGDRDSSDRSIGRLLAGPPRVAPFFADLDPSAGGGVFVSAAADAFTVTWCGVPDYDATGKLTAQASLLPGGAIEVRIDSSTTLREAVVGLSPGGAASLTPLDLSSATATSSAGGSGAVAERFAPDPGLDLVAASRAFYAAFADAYDQLVFWTDARAIESGTFAFESTVRNAITGIGADTLNTSAEYGSGGALESVVLMDDLGKYPADPNARANGENTSLALVAHETGHRWGATLRFRDAGGKASDAWLGRQLAHWSFFFDSDASVLEGNDIEETGGGFRTVDAVRRYGPFDLYAMGLLAPSEVPASFYVESPAGTSQTRESAPRTGVSFSGTRRNVTIDDVVAAMGAREPASSGAPRRHRQAWVYVVSRGRTADPAAIAKLEMFRRAFEGYFFEATGRRMSVETRLD